MVFGIQRGQEKKQEHLLKQMLFYTWDLRQVAEPGHM